MNRLKLLLISLIAILAMGFAGCSEPVYYQLSTSSTPGNGGTVNPSGGTYKQGAQVTFVATPANYYKFNGWAGDISGTTNPSTIKMNSNKNVVASFIKITYSLQLSVDNLSSGTVDPNNGNYEAGNQVKVTATPTKGYRFDHWGGSTTGTANPISILMDNNKTITAYFTRQYTLTVGVSPVGSGSVSSGNEVYDSGNAVTLTAVTGEFPYAFDHWSSTDNNVVNPTTVTMNADKAVTAYFKTLNGGTPVTSKTDVSSPSVTVGKFQLNQAQWIQFEFKTDYDVSAHIVDANNSVVKELSRIQNGAFQFQAPKSGLYTLIVYANYAPAPIGALNGIWLNQMPNSCTLIITTYS